MNIKKILFLTSVFCNFLLLALLVFLLLDGKAERANGKLGVLTQDIDIGVFDTNKVSFKLPKGLVVRDASATGAGWFEPHRFRLVITSNQDNLVDYFPSNFIKSKNTSEFYSADVVKNHKIE